MCLLYNTNSEAAYSRVSSTTPTVRRSSCLLYNTNSGAAYSLVSTNSRPTAMCLLYNTNKVLKVWQSGSGEINKLSWVSSFYLA
ncbi:hypothetical protein Hamer_G025304 [Homarus americanus]|uniref:Uncharacterized protein n=1 Tax=Homarus americanus TaxID=6706 RepID=A0A8J5N3A4_HOMAM|nr:hypothetical protein Hamer_G025304 [Homarus americanus]